MADRSLVDDSKSKIFTRFLLNTCGLLQLSEHQEEAAELGILNDNDRPLNLTLTTGSVAEFYIQPMLSCVGDIDIMVHLSTELAIPAGSPLPSQLPAEFHSRVQVYEIIDSEYPGYVYLKWSYLLTENADDDKYDAVQSEQHGSYMSFTYDNVMDTEINGPAVTISILEIRRDLSIDRVVCVHCLLWPTQAADWLTRHRNYGWPDSATVDRVVSNGCDVVRVAHRLCRQDERVSRFQWRLSFSRAEIVLINSWMPVQQIVYHMLRFFVKNEKLTDITDNTGRKILSNYNIKTLMLWACELKPSSWWIGDLNVVRISVVLLHTLADWLRCKNCRHYFVNNCNLFDTALLVEIIASRLVSTTQSWLSTWFVNNYLRKCVQLCPNRVSRLFEDANTDRKLQNAVSAVVDWRQNSALEEMLRLWIKVEFYISRVLLYKFLNVRLCDYWIKSLARMDSRLNVYFTPAAFLHIAYKARESSLNDELADVLATILGKFVGKRRHHYKLSSVLSQAAEFMKVVANSSSSTVQQIEIELSKAYLYRALRYNDSDSDSIYCLANVYLAVLYYTTGHYQTAIDHCKRVAMSQDHSQCSSHVVQGELLPKIDDSIDSVLGLAVFYQYVRTVALNHQQQTQHVSVFTTELFAHYLLIKTLPAMNCRQFVQMPSGNGSYNLVIKQAFITDLLLLKSLNISRQQCDGQKQPEQQAKTNINSTELDTSELVELLQQSAVEHLTIYRQLQVQKFGSVATIVTTDFEALYAYKRGDYQQCLLLSTLNVRRLLNAVRVHCISIYPEFIQLLDDDIVSLIALTLITYPQRGNNRLLCTISQLTLSLYLMTQCQLKLHHSVKSLAHTLHYIKVAQSKLDVKDKFERLTLKMTKRELISRVWAKLNGAAHLS